MSAYKVYIDDSNIIVVEAVGDQNRDSIEAMAADTQTAIDQMHANSQPALIFDDITQIGYTDSQTRSRITELTRSMPFERVAMYGQGMLAKYGANFMIRAYGLGDKVRYFDDEAKAKAWLKSPLKKTNKR